MSLASAWDAKVSQTQPLPQAVSPRERRPVPKGLFHLHRVMKLLSPMLPLISLHFPPDVHLISQVSRTKDWTSPDPEARPLGQFNNVGCQQETEKFEFPQKP